MSGVGAGQHRALTVKVMLSSMLILAPWTGKGTRGWSCAESRG